jgi:hypothetical protein
MEEKYPCPKMNWKQKLSNFWYYHKWMVIVCSFFVAFILIATVQLVLKNDADLSLLYIGSHNVGETDCDHIVASVEEKIIDVDGDGNKTAELRTIQLPSDINLLNEGQKIQAQEEYRQYSNEILGGDSEILLLDEYFYEELATTGALVNLCEVFTELPPSAIDYYGLSLKKTPLYQLPGFSALPENTILCLKQSSPVSSRTEEERVEMQIMMAEQFRLLVAEESN